MPSTIRIPYSSQPQTLSSVSPLKRKAMSLTQTYYLAHTARGKLSSEAARADHDLRLLVGHANLLDSLMLELAAAEQEQESWFNQSVGAATKTVEEPKHIQWADTIMEEPEQDWQAEDADSDSSDSESELDDESVEVASAGIVSFNRVQSRHTLYDESDEEFDEDDEEDYASLSLTRTKSHSAQPPELSHDFDDSSSDDESMPPSPPSTSLPSFSEKQRQQIATTSFYEQSQSTKLSPTEQASFFEDGYYLPQRSEVPGLISAISVY